MTAEVAILNKLGVALAADSTVSIGDKTYDSANKLFALSKYHPVGILVYNTMDMTTVPMEILIKAYRERLKSKSHKKLEDYSLEFRKHLSEKTPFDKDEERDNVSSIVQNTCRKLHAFVTDKCDDSGLDLDATGDGTEIKKILNEELDRLDDRATKVGRFPDFTDADEEAIAKTYGALIKGRVQRQFRSFKLTARKYGSIEKLVQKSLASKLLSEDYTGFVIAGYGDQEHYPSIIPYRTDGFIVGKLKINSGEPGTISNKSNSIVYPFAQSDMVQLFVEGISDTYQRYIERGIRDIFYELATTTGKYFGVTNTRKIGRLRTELSKQAKDLISKVELYRDREYVKPLLDTIKHLDKAELALLAESLVNITALKRKISPEIETVGGPIDVAVISKGDGFIWIKRKHYFDRTFNPFYFQKYLGPGET